MPFIQITTGPGRTVEQKRDLLAAVSQSTADATGAALPAVRAWIVEVPPTDMAITGEAQADGPPRRTVTDRSPPAQPQATSAAPVSSIRTARLAARSSGS
ncbi:tautomerase family protein [Blastococcus sp. SYSU DS1024]